MRTQDESSRILLAILSLLVISKSAIECVDAGAFNGKAFSFVSFLADDGSILTEEDAVFNATERSYDINSRAYLTGEDLEESRCGSVLYSSPIRMVANSGAATASFNTSFTFAFLKTNFTKLRECGSGMVFTFVTHPDFTAVEKSRRGKGMCTFNPADVDESNRVFAVKFDSSYSEAFQDPSDSNIGVIVSNSGKTRVFQYNLCGPGVAICRLFCGDRGNFSAWIDYDSASDILEVRFRNGSLGVNSKPLQPVIRVSDLRLHKVLEKEMYVGFTASTFNAELHRIRSWSFNSSTLPDLKNSLPNNVIVGISVAILGASLILGLVGCFIWRRCNNLREKPLYMLRDQVCGSNSTDTPRGFTYRELSKATKNFSVRERLSGGAFGDVFRGTLPSGALVAVKRLKGNREQSEESFLAEATSLRKIRHRNLLQLRGWCFSSEGLLLVYDYMCNGSLNKWLHRKAKGPGLSWPVRRSILAGVASGLAYLHEEWVQCILHRDIKSSNVMLDANFNAYLGDFGLARLVDHHKREKITVLAGTLGYMAPEMQHTGRATKETDVYAFGILILEVVCERRPLASQAVEPGDLVLLERVWRAHEAGNIMKVADTSLETRITPELGCGELEENTAPATAVAMAMARFLHVGLLCCLPNPSDRPSMRAVAQWLQESSDVELLPTLPAFRPVSLYSEPHSSSASSSSTSATFQTWGFSHSSSSAV